MARQRFYNYMSYCQKLEKIMFKRMQQGLNDWWRNMAHSSWHKVSCGAAQRARCFSFAHGNEWRRKDKHQKTHDNHHHKSHTDR